jgi:hypothetical protein
MPPTLPKRRRSGAADPRQVPVEVRADVPHERADALVPARDGGDGLVGEAPPA